MTSSFICIKRAATISLFSLSPDVAGLEPKWHLALFPPRRCCTSLQPRSPIFSISGFPVTSSPARLFARYAGNASKHVFPSRKPQEIPSMEPFLHHQPASQPGHYIYPSANSLHQQVPLRSHYSEFLKQNSIILKWKSQFLKENS